MTWPPPSVIAIESGTSLIWVTEPCACGIATTVTDAVSATTHSRRNPNPARDLGPDAIRHPLCRLDTARPDITDNRL